jgi:molecular chaperone GrpE (heat shock protein)
MDPGNIMGSGFSMDQGFGMSGNSKGQTTQMNPEPIPSIKQFEASAFKSTPRSNNFSNNSNVAISPHDTPPSEVMKITSGFNPKIPKQSSLENKGLINPIPQYVTTTDLQPNQQIAVQNQTNIGQLYPQNIDKSESEEKSKEDEGSSGSGAGESTKGPKKAKKERNRESARECRKRKKQYVESLEKQVKDLTEELAQCKKETETLKSRAQQDYTDIRFALTSLNQSREDMLNALSKICQESHKEGMMNDLLSSLNV